MNKRERVRVVESARELYGLPAGQFTAARNEAVKAARAAGDSGSATAIAGLRKPNAVAAAANALVRTHSDELDQLLQLGEAMRSATSSLDAAQLRQLTSRQHQVILALVNAARADVANGLSEATARGLEDTLRAAMADAAAADRLATGQLTGGLSSSGFPGLDLGGASVGPAADTSRSAARRGKATGDRSRGAPSKRGGELEQARRVEADAAAAAEQADSDVAQQAHKLDQAEQASADAAARVAGLEAELADARSARTEADKVERVARREHGKAERAADRARRDAGAAAAARERLQR